MRRLAFLRESLCLREQNGGSRMLTILALILGSVIGWFAREQQNIDEQPKIALDKERDSYDRTMNQITSEVGADFNKYFGVKGALLSRPQGRDEDPASVVIRLDDFMTIVTHHYFSDFDYELIKQYAEENDLPEDDMDAVFEHYSSSALNKYDSARRESFNKIMSEL